uniref:Signal peptidase complex catalytic subunit SEC11 n=1 Tax=Kalanchoe fedtschenkoi TaxID=63787 RepID=A0A7N0VK95_KALFE
MVCIYVQGDALLLHMDDSPVRSGDIVVFSVQGQEISIVHRVIKVHQERNVTQVNFILTKGDNNPGDDRWGIYADGQQWVEQKDVLGKVFGVLPYVGWPSIIMNEHPMVKYLLLGSLSLLAIITD